MTHAAPSDLPVLVTYDWVPDFPRGFVRDLRIRWAMEELGRPYSVECVPFAPKTAAHLAIQPFGQVPILKDGDRTLFESGAILLDLARDGSPLMPEGRRAEVTQWLFAALNSVEKVSERWMIMVLSARLPQFFGPVTPPDLQDVARARLDARLGQLADVIAGREWLVGSFSAADIAMVDVLRVIAPEGALDAHPALADYVARATIRPAFQKAYADHMAHWHRADDLRRAAG